MAPDKSTKAEADVKKLFRDCDALLIQMALLYTNPEDPENTDIKILALTDSGGLEKIAKEVNAKGETRIYSYFNLDSDYLILATFRSNNQPQYDIAGFTVERSGYLLKVAAFKELEQR